VAGFPSHVKRKICDRRARRLTGGEHHGGLNMKPLDPEKQFQVWTPKVCARELQRLA